MTNSRNASGTLSQQGKTERSSMINRGVITGNWDKKKSKSRQKAVRKCKKNCSASGLWSVFINEFCSHTTIHGLNHVAEKVFTPFERSLWAWLFVAGVMGASYSALQIWEKYKTGSTATFVETTSYDYSNVPFPAVILCDKTRVHWPRALELTPSDLPPPYNVTKEKTLTLLKRLGYVTFGDFDFLNDIRHMNFDEIEDLNVSQILLKVMRPCEEMFPELCVWRGLEFNCCQLFELQKTELGFCYSFNSDTSEISRRLSYGWAAKEGVDYWVDSRGEKRPRRTAQIGLWGGLRFTVNVIPQEEMPPDGNDTVTGIAVMVVDPRTFPMQSYAEIGRGQFGVVSVWGDALVSEPRVRAVAPRHRRCLFSDEGPPSPTGHYSLANCKTLCYQTHAFNYCNCSPDFIFYDTDGFGNAMPACNVYGLMCLSRYNVLRVNWSRLSLAEILTTELPDSSRIFFNNPGMSCDCPSDCNNQQYISGMTITQNLNKSETISVDVNFKMSTCVLYKTDIRYDWLEVIVAFGGIAGLFLGASLMSGVEILYFITIRLYYIKRHKHIHEETKNTKKNQEIKVLPWIY